MVAKTEDACAQERMHLVCAGDSLANLPDELLELDQLRLGKARVFVRCGQMGRNTVDPQLRMFRHLLQDRDRLFVPTAHSAHPGIDCKIDRGRFDGESPSFCQTGNASDKAISANGRSLVRQRWTKNQDWL